MIILFCFIALITAGLIVGPYLADNTGYVLFAFDTWTIELTMMSLVIILASTGLTIWLLYRATTLSSKALVQSSQWLKARKIGKQDNLAYLAMLKHLLLNIERGDESIITAISNIPERDNSPLSTFIRSIHLAMTGDYNAARLCMDSALKNDALPEHHSVMVASQILRIMLAIRTDDSDSAYQTYQTLPAKHDFIVEIVPAELPLICKFEGFEAARQRLEEVKKLLPTTEYQQWQIDLMHQQLSAVASNDGGNALSDYWQKAKRKVKNNVNHQQAYLTVLTELNLHNKASDYVISVSGKSCVEGFLPLIAQLRPTTPVAVKKQLESWLKQAPKDIALLRAYAHFCANNGEDALAISSLTALLTITPSINDVATLASLHEKQGQQEQALALYRRLPELVQ